MATFQVIMFVQSSTNWLAFLIYVTIPAVICHFWISNHMHGPLRCSYVCLSCLKRSIIVWASPTLVHSVSRFVCMVRMAVHTYFGQYIIAGSAGYLYHMPLLLPRVLFHQACSTARPCLSKADRGGGKGQPPVADLEGVPRIPWNPPFKDKLVAKNLSDLAQSDPTCRAEIMCVWNCRHNLPTSIGWL